MNDEVARLVRSPGALEAALITFLQAKPERRVFLTMAEAAEFSGLPASFLRQLIATGQLKALKTGAGWRISRAGIERLSDTVSEAVPGELTEHELRDLETNRNRRRGPVTSELPDPA
jgi:excisionase family DNA binding protein